MQQGIFSAFTHRGLVYVGLESRETRPDNGDEEESREAEIATSHPLWGCWSLSTNY